MVWFFIGDLYEKYPRYLITRCYLAFPGLSIHSFPVPLLTTSAHGEPAAK